MARNNGMRFYFDYGSPKAKRKGGDAPNAIAVDPDSIIPGGMLSAAAALTDQPNSPVCGTMASREYIADSCKRVSKAEAYRVHPRLKQYLED